jgi:hypothetical protein
MSFKNQSLLKNKADYKNPLGLEGLASPLLPVVAFNVLALSPSGLAHM